jgi:hypothetical protein
MALHPQTLTATPEESRQLLYLKAIYMATIARNLVVSNLQEKNEAIIIQRNITPHVVSINWNDFNKLIFNPNSIKLIIIHQKKNLQP